MNEIDPGHVYDLPNKNGEGVQRISFIKKQPKEGGAAGELELVHDGVTTESVLEMLIARMKVLQERLPDHATFVAQSCVENALTILKARIADRESRGVSGTNLA